MKFTLVFRSSESIDISAGLVFVPSPCWVVGEEVILNLNLDYPHYRLTSVKKLLESEYFSRQSYRNEIKECIIVVHQTGHGSQKDLDLLMIDLENEGFKFKVVYFDN